MKKTTIKAILKALVCTETLKMLSAVQGLDNENCFHIINVKQLQSDNYTPRKLCL